MRLVLAIPWSLKVCTWVLIINSVAHQAAKRCSLLHTLAENRGCCSCYSLKTVVQQRPHHVSSDHSKRLKTMGNNHKLSVAVGIHLSRETMESVPRFSQWLVAA